MQVIRQLRHFINQLKYLYLVKIWKMDIHPTTRFSLSVKFDYVYPKGLHIGPKTYIAFGVSLLTHDMTRGLFADTYIGENCFIGAESIILPGVKIGNNSIVAAGSVVTRDVPPFTIVAGNPARVIKENIEVKAYGRFLYADQNESNFLEGKK